MKPISDALRAKIDLLRKTQDNDAEPTWVLNIFRNRERMLGSIQGARITSGADQDIQPAIAQGNDGRYHVVFGRGGQIWEMVSSPTNIPAVTWDDPEPIFSGEDPDLDYDGFFDSVGTFTPTNLMIVYEQPAGTIKFRKKLSGSWTTATTVASGANPSLCRAWADPPSIGTDDQGFIVFYTQSGHVKYTYSDDEGDTWQTPVTVDYPAGGTKTNVQVFRVADYTLGIVYEYDNGLTSEIWFLKTTRRYVNIASPDETFETGVGGFRQLLWEIIDLDAGEHTLDPGLPDEYRHDTFGVDQQDQGDETIGVVLPNSFRQVLFSGVNP